MRELSTINEARLLRLTPGAGVTLYGNPHFVQEHYVFRPHGDQPVVHRLKVTRVRDAETKWLLLIEHPGKLVAVRSARAHSKVPAIAPPWPDYLQVGKVNYGPFVAAQCGLYRYGEAEPFAEGDYIYYEWDQPSDLGLLLWYETWADAPLAGLLAHSIDTGFIDFEE